MLFREHDVGDLRLYYGSCFLRINRGLKGQSEWVMVETFDNVNDKIQLDYYHPSSIKSKTIMIRENPRPNVNPEFPDSQFYYHKGQAFYLYRLSKRNASKALCFHNAQWNNPLRQVGMDWDHLAVPETWQEWCDTLQNGDVQFPLAKLNKVFEKGRVVSLPIHKHWMVSLSANEGNKFMLFHRTTPVGYLNDQVVTPINDIFIQEIRDVFPNLKVG